MDESERKRRNKIVKRKNITGGENDIIGERICKSQWKEEMDIKEIL